MRTEIAEVYDPKASRQKIQIRILKFFKVIGFIVLFLLSGIILRYTIDHTIGQFPDLYDAIEFLNNDFERADIYNIVYGDKTATVMYKAYDGYSRACYYHHDGLWAFTNVMYQSIDIEPGYLTICKTMEGSDWFVYATLYTDEGADGEDELIDCNGTELNLIRSSDYSYYYFAYIHPQSENYSISVNGKEYEVELKHYGRRIPFMRE